MKVIKKGIVVISLASVGVGYPFLAAKAHELATVNGTKITEKDLENALTSLNNGQKEAYLRDPSAKREVLMNVIDREILAQEAEKLKIDSDEQFRKALAIVRRELLVNRILDKKIASQITNSEVKKYYSANREKFSTDSVHVQHILVGSEEEAKKVMAMAKDKSNDFQQLAEKYSKDPSAKNNRGDIGYIAHGQMVPEFTDMAFSLEKGQVGGPVHTTYGYHIIKCVERKTGKPLEFAEVEMQVKEALKRELERNYVDSLKKTAKIEIE